MRFPRLPTVPSHRVLCVPPSARELAGVRVHPLEVARNVSAAVSSIRVPMSVPVAEVWFFYGAGVCCVGGFISCIGATRSAGWCCRGTRPRRPKRLEVLQVREEQRQRESFSRHPLFSGVAVFSFVLCAVLPFSASLRDLADVRTRGELLSAGARERYCAANEQPAAEIRPDL